MKRWIMVLSVTLAAVLLFGCGKKGTSVPMSETTNNAAGVQWKVPQGWEVEGQRMMRVATYSIPKVEGDEDAGECAVFFFGAGQGGDIEMNIDRWTAQFEGIPSVSKSSEEINGLNVTKVEIAGAYLAPSGPMMESQGTKDNYLLLGAIVSAPEGSVFFKSTGPQKTIENSKAAFEAMLSTVEKL